jgi:ABC-type nitrate/sulfonate/bicarbonate transport system permease component
MKDYNTRQRQELFKRTDYQYIFAVIFTIILVGFLFIQASKNLDRWALETCEQYNDCEEVVRHLNK